MFEVVSTLAAYVHMWPECTYGVVVIVVTFCLLLKHIFVIFVMMSRTMFALCTLVACHNQDTMFIHHRVHHHVLH